ncbi:LamG domain-containing protein [Pseudarcicella hirudinis]|nr:LamG domain-containing protein [Pseudarcicella hirudinis]
MKNIKNSLFLAGVLGSGLILSSCYEKFDEKSYAPSISIGGFTSTKDIAPSNLVGYWSFDNNYIDAVSNTAGENSGTSFVPGIKGNAIQGADKKYVVSNVSPAVQNLKSFTVTTWVNTPQNTKGIVGLLDIANPDSFWGNLTIFLENGSTDTKGLLKIHVNNNGTDAWLGNYDLNNFWNTWTSIGVSYDETSSTFKVFVNGNKIATQVVKGFGAIKFQKPTRMVFGTVQFQTSPSLNNGTSQDWASYLTGQLDEVRIYNKALSESEVNALVKLEGRGK